MKLICKECPCIKGDTWCGLHNKETWKNNKMCREGIFERICKGVTIAGEFYYKNKKDKRVADIEAKLKILDQAHKELVDAEDQTEGSEASLS